LLDQIAQLTEWPAELPLLTKVERLRADIQRGAPYTAKQAQQMSVCRLCGKSAAVFTPPDSLVLNHGKEFAHQFCLDKAAEAAKSSP